MCCPDDPPTTADASRIKEHPSQRAEALAAYLAQQAEDAPAPAAPKERGGFAALLRDAFATGRFRRCHRAALDAVLGVKVNEVGGGAPRGAQRTLAREMSLTDAAISNWAKGATYMEAANWSLFTSLYEGAIRSLSSPNLRERALAGYRQATLEANSMLRRAGEVCKAEANRLEEKIVKQANPKKGVLAHIRGLRQFYEMTARLRTSLDEPEPASATPALHAMLVDFQFEVLYRMVVLSYPGEPVHFQTPTIPDDELNALWRFCDKRYREALSNQGLHDAQDLASYAESLAASYLPGFLIAVHVIRVLWEKEGQSRV